MPIDLRTSADGDDYRQRFADERERLFAALGALTEGGVIEAAARVGGTSVAGLLAQPVMDIALAVWPFPLEDAARSSLAALGYTLDPGFAGEPEQRFAHASGETRLIVTAAGDAHWMDYLLVRDYLRRDAAARQAFSERKRAWRTGEASEAGYEEAKRRWLDTLVEEARRTWVEREGFAPLRRIVEEVRDLPIPWRVAGGWSLDLFLGSVRRVHLDVDIVISRADQLALRAYLLERGWKLLTPHEHRLHPWPEHMRLEPPRFQAHAHRDGLFIDFMLTEMEGGVWRFRRQPEIVRDLSRIELRTGDGVPYLAPELGLLFKSKTSGGETREKDRADFETAFPHLDPERRAWLRWALTAYDPTHPWLARLAADE